MKNMFMLAILFLLTFSLRLTAQPDVSMIFNEPARHFTASAPLGNGRLGAMVFGNPNNERIVLNEISMWSGGVEDPNNYESYTYLPQIQKLLLDGKNIEAQELLQKYFVCKHKGSSFGNGGKVKFGCYQTLGDLRITWNDTLQAVSNYNRVLQLNNALCTTTWDRGGVQYSQQAFVSGAQQAIVVRLSANKKGKITFTTSLYRKERADIKATVGQIEMGGTLYGGKNDDGIQYASVLKVEPIGGKIMVNGNTIEVVGADECTLIITARTNMNWPNVEVRGENPAPIAMTEAEKASKIEWRDLVSNHINDYKLYFERNRIYFTANEQDYADSVKTLSVKQRLIRLKKGGADPALVSLYYNFGRYLLISSSRQGGLPANLQGLWAEEYQTPWNGDYHININLQMNYWLAEVGNLSDCHEPYFRLINQMAHYGKQTAKAYYNSEGWVAHIITNPWGFTAPGEHASWGSTLTGGCWSATHLWQHYLFTRDNNFLKEYYPILKGSAQFYTDVLIEEPKHKWLVTAPSNSPENTYLLPNGQYGQTCMGPTMDMQIGRELLDAVIQASKILNVDADLRAKLTKIRQRLAPNQISPTNGGVQEWLDDYKEGEPQHRHVSHLYGLHPYDEITPWDTPEMAKAAVTTLMLRGNGGTGWSRAWKIAFWTRLANGDNAYLMLKELLNAVDPSDALMRGGAGTYPNLFCAHPPFQIDGNFGATAGIAEMLIQSHGKQNIIRLLPALPTLPALASGRAKGFCARGGFVVDFEWTDGKVKEVELKSTVGGVCRVNLPTASYKVVDANGKTIANDKKSNIISFASVAGGKYVISSIK